VQEGVDSWRGSSREAPGRLGLRVSETPSEPYVVCPSFQVRSGREHSQLPVWGFPLIGGGAKSGSVICSVAVCASLDHPL